MVKQKTQSLGLRSFLLSLSILLLLMLGTALLSRYIPAGTFERHNVAGSLLLDPSTYRQLESPAFPLWRCFTAPFELLFAPDALIVWIIIFFLLLIGGSFSVLEQVGLMNRLLQRLFRRFAARRKMLLAVTSLCFMLFGSIFGIFEEMILLLPLCLQLARCFGWDNETALGMSVLASALGFASATFNPFTLGVAQQVAELPAYSGLLLRLAVFATVYACLLCFLLRHINKIEQRPAAQLAALARATELAGATAVPSTAGSVTAPALPQGATAPESAKLDRGLAVLGWCLLSLPLLLISSFFLKDLASLLFPLLALLFGLISLAAAFSAGSTAKAVGVAFLQGLKTMLPAILLILFASSIKFIMLEAQIMDTILYRLAALLKDLSPLASLWAIFFIIMFLNFFISSGSAKALLVLPLILPLLDMAQLSRQMAVQALLFGDGFSNILYPSNAVLMISLGLAQLSYPRWLRFSWPIHLLLLLLSLAWLALALALGYGP